MLRWTLRHPRIRALPSPLENGVAGVRFARTRHPSNRQSRANPEPFAPLPTTNSPQQGEQDKFALTTYDVDGRPLSEERAYRFPAPSSDSKARRRRNRNENEQSGDVHKPGDFPTEARGARDWVRKLLTPTDGSAKSSISTTAALAAAQRFLNEQPVDAPDRGHAYHGFYRAFLRHPYGAVPASSLLKRQMAEGVPLTAHRALTAIKAVREYVPSIHDLMPILPADMTPELLAAIAQAIVLQTGPEPAAVKVMVGSALAAIEAEPGKEQTREVVPLPEWPLQLFFPLILAYFPRADFRGAIRVLGDLRAAARYQRELARDTGRKWPGTASPPILACYTAAMSLWVRSHLEPRGEHRPRAGVRVGSTAPSHLATDLAALLEPLRDYTDDVLRDWGVDGKASSSAASGSGAVVEPHENTSASSLTATQDDSMSQDEQSTLKAKQRRIRHRLPFLTTWMNAERIAHNLSNAARVWEQITWQSVAETVAGVRPPYAPPLEANIILLKLLKVSPPPSYRPLAAHMIRERVPTELLNGLLACIALPNTGAGDTWTRVASDPYHLVSDIPPATSPDLAMMYALLHRAGDAVDMRTVDIVGAAVVRAARQGVNATRFKFVPGSTHAHIVRSEWDWLNDAVWGCAQAEAARQGNAAEVLPRLPLSQPEAELEVLPPTTQSGQLADITTTVSFPGQRSSVHEVMPALTRLLRDTLIAAARQRRVPGSAEEVLAAEMAALPPNITPTAPKL